MSKVAMTEVSMERCPLDMPYEILLEIFRNLPKSILIEISRLSSKFRDVAGDTRIWKNVTISYDSAPFAFEELYSEPWPVKGVDLQQAKIDPPVSLKTDQLVKVTRLYLSFFKTSDVIIEAILDKYQCTELYLDCTDTVDNILANRSHIIEISSEAISKLKSLEVLGLRDTNCVVEPNWSILTGCSVQLAPVLSHCKNLKTLYLSHALFFSSDLLGFVQKLPASLEKLFLGYSFWLEDESMTRFFELLADSTPNLRELELCPKAVQCPSLLAFQFLETLYVTTFDSVRIADLSKYLKKFPALKTVTVYIGDGFKGENYPNPILGKLRTTLEPHGVVVKQIRRPECWSISQNGDLWKVSKAA